MVRPIVKDAASKGTEQSDLCEYSTELLMTGNFTRPMDPQPSTPTRDESRQRPLIGCPSRVWTMARGRVDEGRVVLMR
jgi:hypothetical protein